MRCCPFAGADDSFTNNNLELARVQRGPGLNDVGMVAWHITLKTPECQQGRQVRSTWRQNTEFSNQLQLAANVGSVNAASLRTAYITRVDLLLCAAYRSSLWPTTSPTSQVPLDHARMRCSGLQESWPSRSACR